MKDENIDIEITKEPDEATLIKEKRIKMWKKIFKLEKENLNKVVKDSDAEMARKIKSIIERYS